jgi:transposase
MVKAERRALQQWLVDLPGSWVGAMEATMFTGWIYDFLKPYALELKVAHPAMLKAITAAKKKNDRADAEKLADLLRVNLLPECTMMSEKLRELRRILRYRNMIVRIASKMKNKISGLLMEVGAVYDKRRLHGKKYFGQLLERVEDVPESVKDLLKLSRSNMELFEAVQKKLLKTLRENSLISKRVELLRSISGVGEVMALTWVLEIGDPERFSNSRQAISYSNDLPVGPCSPVDYESCYAARHLRCFEADGLTQTQSSLTGQDLEEGKWMSGRRDRRTTGKDLKRSES